ncbi:MULTISPECIES: peptide chain release factor N(5)-glutamine methyltransferase [unclassified Undibacterium]|uniref:peptide chain release factor N(5)-glutamine methyltransferase n=1 Tax=unclassified Undibacterium TaxID=2630295 RepID=UPI002AC9D956|nr:MULTISPECIES: peptide chain release factor N(5)-glutamine methyltransferase [unclassified Undibacterium]MEB0140224.1 peptide chain release factor N(5)-glutamine methyltransferase [Undibacterium sp. CCC2.1]MEB0173237.1 peptide chain release factor N(5)-glutamine methyltransferase [Undibacterium sp. CCC1.1]MEB0177074.1 peptide chain release factor N(5)-glutamine methyltransferase [Undibacterium sp. CCC3.4]MEB0216345.1 peptide chain release factor N(5)-glutamine methyltransferase [Undibacterium
MQYCVPVPASVAACERSAPLERLEARSLLMHASGLSRIELITRSETLLSTSQAAQFEALVRRRQAGEPIAYLTGRREFYGLSFHTTPAVLIPRADTELLVDLALAHAAPHSTLLDLGTGSGAIAIAIASQRSDLSVTALDRSMAALDVARQNAQELLPQTELELLHSDWFAAVSTRRFASIVSNPPYIVAGDPHLSQGDLRFEPLDALTDHGDGLLAYRHIIGAARAHLSPDGWLLLEHGYDQAAAVRDLLSAAGFTSVSSWRDLPGHERVSGGQARAV